MRKIKVMLLIVLGVLSQVQAQQDPAYTHYMYNQNIMNPAYVGSKDYLSANFLYRNQWVDIDGAPEVLTLSVHGPIKDKIGLGLSVTANKVGPVKEQTVFADIAYTINVGEEDKLSFGIKAGFSFLSGNLTELILLNNGDNAFSRDFDKASPNFGAGLFYHNERFYAGVSVPSLLRTYHFEDGNGKVSTASEKMHGFITTGYIFELNDELKLKPSMMMRAAPDSPLSVDVSANALIKERFEVGLSYRLDDSVSAMFNIKAGDRMRIGYAYDYTVSNLGNYNSGTHEVFLLFDFIPSTTLFRSPRFF